MTIISTLASLFTRRNEVESAETNTRSSESRLSAKRSVVDALAKTLADATAGTGAARGDLAAAEAAYADDPKAATAKAVRDAREALELAVLRERKPREQHEAAAAELATLEADHAAAVAALEAARIEARKAELREFVTVASFRSDVAADVTAYLDAEDAMVNRARSIETKLEARRAAVRELDQLGEKVDDFDTAHGALAIFVEGVKRGGAIRADVMSSVLAIRNYFTQPQSNSFLPSAREPFGDHVSRLIRVFAVRTDPCPEDRRAECIEDLELVTSFADLRRAAETMEAIRRRRGKECYEREQKKPKPAPTHPPFIGGTPRDRSRAAPFGGAPVDMSQPPQVEPPRAEPERQ